MKTLTKKELKLQATIKARFDGELPRYRSVDEQPEAVELTMTDVDAYNRWSHHVHTDFNGYLTKGDDWTLTADERRTAGERQQRAEDALLTSSSAQWWAALSPSGFGPVAAEELGTTASVTYDGTEAITTIDAIDPDEVRVDAGIVEMGQFRSKVRKGEESGLYRDFIRSARMFAADDEQADLWTEDGYSWERLDDNELAAELPSFTAYWE